MSNALMKWAQLLIPRRYHYPIRQFYYDLRALWYYGENFTCPWCHGTFRTFIQYRPPTLPFADTFCPRCYAFERHRLLWFYLSTYPNLLSLPLRMLHVAPEYMIQKYFSKLSGLDYISIDKNSSLAMMLADITSLPYPSNIFNVILCSHVLEHILSDQRAMVEIYRVLKPGGWALLLVPINWSLQKTIEDPSIVDPTERTRLFGQHDHVRAYGIDYFDRLTNAGFKVKIDHFAETLDSSIINRYGINAQEKIILGFKPSH